MKEILYFGRICCNVNSQINQKHIRTINPRKTITGFSLEPQIRIEGNLLNKFSMAKVKFFEVVDQSKYWLFCPAPLFLDDSQSLAWTID